MLLAEEAACSRGWQVLVAELRERVLLRERVPLRAWTETAGLADGPSSPRARLCWAVPMGCRTPCCAPVCPSARDTHEERGCVSVALGPAPLLEELLWPGSPASPCSQSWQGRGPVPLWPVVTPGSAAMCLGSWPGTAWELSLLWGQARLSPPAPPACPSAAPGVGKMFGSVSLGLPTCVRWLPAACELSWQASSGSLTPWRDKAWGWLPCGAAWLWSWPTCGQEEEEDTWDGGGRLGTPAPTLPAAPAAAPRQLRATPSHHRPLPPAPSRTWGLFSKGGSLRGLEWVFASSSMGILGVVCCTAATGTLGRCCLLRSCSPGNGDRGDPRVTMASGHDEAPTSQSLGGQHGDTHLQPGCAWCETATA